MNKTEFQAQGIEEIEMVLGELKLFISPSFDMNAEWIWEQFVFIGETEEINMSS
jgi:hypothetical protein